MKKFLLAIVFAGLAAALHGQQAVAETFAEQVDRIARKDVTVAGIREHQRILQAIANRNGRTRASGTPGFKESVEYVALRLRDAGYKTTVLPFTFPYYQENSPPELAQIRPQSVTYQAGTQIVTMEYSGAGSLTQVLQPVGGIVLPPTPEPSSASGCFPAHFRNFVRGRIALIQRGTCLFAEKVALAKAAGASAVIIFNEGQPGRKDAFGGTLGGPVDIPVLSASFTVGRSLLDLNLPLMKLKTDTASEQRVTWNVMGQSKGGRVGRTVVVGAHLDSVVAGPGINDNGSGTATNLEAALRLAKYSPYFFNRVQFLFFGAEEPGLLGSENFAATLSQQELDSILLNLNFDMLGSPNYIRLVYDGDGSDTPDAGPPGSEIIENVFLNYFGTQHLATAATAFDGRSDYGPFIDRGIPAGGLFSGAEEIKTPEEAAIFGGQANAPLDPCYHQACDTYQNFNARALDELGDAAVHAIVKFAFADANVITNPPPEARQKKRIAASTRLYRGSKLQK